MLVIPGITKHLNNKNGRCRQGVMNWVVLCGQQEQLILSCRISCDCISRFIALLFIWLLLTKKKKKEKLNPRSHKIIKQLGRRWLYLTKEVPASLTESPSDWLALVAANTFGAVQKQNGHTATWVDSPTDGWHDRQCLWHVRRCRTQQLELMWRIQHKQNEAKTAQSSVTSFLHQSFVAESCRGYKKSNIIFKTIFIWTERWLIFTDELL